MDAGSSIKASSRYWQASAAMDLRLWAIFERPGDSYISRTLRHAKLKKLHHDSEAIKDAWA